VSSPEASIIIPNWNGMDVLPSCLESLEKQQFRDFECIVVDNGSTDGSAAFVEKEHPHARVLRLERNGGFACAVNAGIRNAGGCIIVVLNNDTVTDPAWLGEIVRAMDLEKEVAFLSCKILNYENRSLIGELGQMYCTNGTIVQLGAGLKDDGSLDLVIRDVFGPTGAAAAYRKSMLDDTGLFDEDFLLYYEDVGLNFRAQLLGYTCRYVPTAVVYHRAGFSTRRICGVQKYMLINRLRVIIKNLPGELLLKHAPLLLEGLQDERKACIDAGMDSLFTEALSCISAEHEMLMRKRESIMARRVLSDSSLAGKIVDRASLGSLTGQKDREFTYTQLFRGVRGGNGERNL